MPRLLEPTLLWDGDRFQRGRRLRVGDDGRIAAVGSPEELPGDPERLAGALVPGLVDAHSHAFQFALRGRAAGSAGPSGAGGTRCTTSSSRWMRTAATN